MERCKEQVKQIDGQIGMAEFVEMPEVPKQRVESAYDGEFWRAKAREIRREDTASA